MEDGQIGFKQYLGKLTPETSDFGSKRNKERNRKERPTSGEAESKIHRGEIY
jgi:hypothetical protein